MHEEIIGNSNTLVQGVLFWLGNLTCRLAVRVGMIEFVLSPRGYGSTVLTVAVVLVCLIVVEHRGFRKGVEG